MASTESPAAHAYESTPEPAPSTPWRDATFSVIDLELTGLDPVVHEIVSFATVTVTGGTVRLADARYRIVRPRRMPDAASVRIHGLRESDLAAAPALEEVFDDLLEALTGRTLVAQVAPIEEGFLRAAFDANGLTLRNSFVDTAALALELRQRRHQRPLGRPRSESSGTAVSSPGLSGLARSLGLPVHRPHHADGDALTAAQVFIALATHLDAYEPQTVGSLVRATGLKAGAPLGRALRRIVTALKGG
jgi:DNA polymerase III subunit epsilon